MYLMMICDLNYARLELAKSTKSELAVLPLCHKLVAGTVD